MPAKKTATKKTTTKKGGKSTKNPLFERRQRVFGIGGNIAPKKDLFRYVKWPKYIQLQRQRRILMSRVKVPPTVNQFSRVLDKSSVTNLFGLLNKYRPESRYEKNQRLKEAASKKKEKESTKTTKPMFVKFGLNHITSLIEQKKAKLVVIAHDVDPIELVLWLPALCRKKGVPYCIVKSKARLGTVVHKKTATALALVDVKPEDQPKLADLANLCKDTFNENADLRRQWGGGRLSYKSAAQKKKRENRRN